MTRCRAWTTASRTRRSRTPSRTLSLASPMRTTEMSEAPFPQRIGPHRVVAFTRITAGPGTFPVQGIAITKDGDRFNVHSVWLADAEIGRWEGQNGRYGITLAARPGRDGSTRPRR